MQRMEVYDIVQQVEAVRNDKEQILAWRIEGVRSKGKAEQGGGGEVRIYCFGGVECN